MVFPLYWSQIFPVQGNVNLCSPPFTHNYASDFFDFFLIEHQANVSFKFKTFATINKNQSKNVVFKVSSYVVNPVNVHWEKSGLKNILVCNTK